MGQPVETGSQSHCDLRAADRMTACAGTEGGHRYVIITPFHNEEALIEGTIKSVLGQTARPLKWILVDDGSTDKTGEIVRQYAALHPFIRLVRLERPPGRCFGHKARAFARGMAELMDLTYDYIGNLDADITLAPDYFQKIVSELERRPETGLIGGLVASSSSSSGEFIKQRVALDSVAGAVQMFRRVCFEQIGGYKPLPFGGIDSAAEIQARMHGWQVLTVPELVVFEHRWTGSANTGALKSAFKEGRKFRSLGYKPVFFFLKCAWGVFEKPILLWSLLAFLGYLYQCLLMTPAALPADVVAYLRAEQKGKLKQLLGLRGSSHGPLPAETPR